MDIRSTTSSALKASDVASSAVQERLVRVEANTQELGMLLGALEQRLYTVVRPVGPTEPGTGAQAARAVSDVPLVMRLDDLGDGLMHGIQAVNSLLSRLEV
ncbi:hypothetical protein I6U33_05305 [Pseudomonas carnis]|uniref:hypothetical protein n=1 Tax=Pseudomonas TaxID=286 RepID=UPI0018E83780|nr:MULTISPECIES: hypothetical protein [Pseudomonas]MBJ2225758.1 hypothetical protein [Pseudomonas sp. MF7451]MBW9236741.1 hypothetical protein [Pseudomonas carnis]